MNCLRCQDSGWVDVKNALHPTYQYVARCQNGCAIPMAHPAMPVDRSSTARAAVKDFVAMAKAALMGGNDATKREQEALEPSQDEGDPW